MKKYSLSAKILATVAGLETILVSLPSSSLAQIVEDETLGSERSRVTRDVQIRGDRADRIDGGARRGGNLFHSFREFNVNEGQRVYFANPNGVENILGRVTGADVSDILGTLGVDGNANLFLLNPNGIVFGPNARLDVAGSFVASTANRFIFADGSEFSANSQSTPLLTLSAPLGVQFGEQPGAIRSQANLVGGAGRSLILAGGNIALDNSNLSVEGGRIELGAIAGPGTVGFETTGNLLSLKIPDAIERADVAVNNSRVNVTAGNGGSISVTARNIDLLGNSRLQAGIGEGLGTADSQAGDITLNATDTLRIAQSRVQNVVAPNAVGNSGDIRITAGLLSMDQGSIGSAVGEGATGSSGNLDFILGSFLSNRSTIGTASFGRGEVGDITINAYDRITLGNNTFLNSVHDGIEGNSGNITVNTNSLSLTNGSTLGNSSRSRGNAGDVSVNARDQILLNSNSSIISLHDEIVGNSGNLNLTTGSLFVRGGSQLSTTSQNQGNAGNVSINARERVVLRGDNSKIDTEVLEGGGQSGAIDINTGTFSITNQALLSTTTFGQGQSGDIRVNARDRVVLNLGAIRASVGQGAVARGGDIRINTGNFSATESVISANTAGQGNAGNIRINARDRVDLNLSIIASAIQTGATGQGGNIDIVGDSISFVRATDVNTTTFGRGDAGDIRIRANRDLSLDGSFNFGGETGLASTGIRSNVEGVRGNGGSIQIDAPSLSMTNGAQIQASAQTQRGNAGRIIVNADQITIDGQTIDEKGRPIRRRDGFSGLITRYIGRNSAGRGGDIEIRTDSLSITNNAAIDASVSGIGVGGDIDITAEDVVSLDEGTVSSTVGRNARGNGGRIRITTGSLFLRDGSNLNASVNIRAVGNAGDIIVDARDVVSLEQGSNIISAVGLGFGNSRDITVRTDSLFIRDGSSIATTNLSLAGEGRSGDIDIDARIIEINGKSETVSRIGTENLSGTAGEIRLRDVDLLLLRNGGSISSLAAEDIIGQGGSGGDITIDADFIAAVPSENSDIIANAVVDRGGNIQINSQSIFGIQPQPELTPESGITASSELGVDGNIEINTPDLDPTRGLIALPTEVVDASQLIARTCPTSGGSANDLGQFVITGRGGLPPNPNEALDTNEDLTEWITLARTDLGTNIETETGSQREGQREMEMRTPDLQAPTPDANAALAEAQGWVVDANGKVLLVTQTPSTLSQSHPWQPSTACN